MKVKLNSNLLAEMIKSDEPIFEQKKSTEIREEIAKLDGGYKRYKGKAVFPDANK